MGTLLIHYTSFFPCSSTILTNGYIELVFTLFKDCFHFKS